MMNSTKHRKKLLQEGINQKKKIHLRNRERGKNDAPITKKRRQSGGKNGVKQTNAR